MSIPSIYTVISKSPYSRLPNSYVDKLVFGPSVRPTTPYNGEQYYDEGDNTFYYWNGIYGLKELCKNLFILFLLI